jgi:hypothetical protein
LDSLLWRKHIRLRHSHQLDYQLYRNPQRPDVRQLIQYNILRGIPARNMEEGRFDVSSIPKQYGATKQLETFMIRTKLTHTLNDRPKPDDLKEKNILSNEALDSVLVSRAEKLKMDFTKARLNRHLKKKQRNASDTESSKADSLCPTIKPQLLYFESFRSVK